MPSSLHPIEKEAPLCLPERLRSLRSYHSLTQEEVAAALFINRSTYSYYEAGSTQPSLSVLAKLALFYDVTTDYLLGYPSPRKKPNAFESELLALIKKYFPAVEISFEKQSVP